MPAYWDAGGVDLGWERRCGAPLAGVALLRGTGKVVELTDTEP